MSQPTEITAIVAGFFLLIALFALLRLLFIRDPPPWRRVKVGVFIEREPQKPTEEDE